MRSLAVYLKNYKKETILAPFFKFLEVVFDLMVPVAVSYTHLRRKCPEFQRDLALEWG